MNKRSRFKNLQDYVAAQPRSKRQGEIARELGLSDGQLSEYLGGRRFPGAKVAHRISQRTGIPIRNLLNLVDEAQAS